MFIIAFLVKSLDLNLYRKLWNQDGKCVPLILNHLNLHSLSTMVKISPDQFLEQGAGWRPYSRHRKSVHLFLQTSPIKFQICLITSY